LSPIAKPSSAGAKSIVNDYLAIAIARYSSQGTIIEEAALDGFRPKYRHNSCHWPSMKKPKQPFRHGDVSTIPLPDGHSLMGRVAFDVTKQTRKPGVKASLQHETIGTVGAGSSSARPGQL
jgi:hypothetical protein